MILLRDRTFAAKKDDRESVPEDIMRKVEETGVIQQDREGRWGIINKRKKVWWTSRYQTRDKALSALRGYQAHKHGG